jgi:tetraacyldisaccharide 4'-kinase
MARWLQAIWYGGRSPPWPLRAAATLFAALVRVRSHGYRHGWLRVRRVGCPVIVVGNVSVGGTGKTPLVLWLVRRLRAQGLRVGIVLRGFGARGADSVRRVNSTSTALEVGDEALLMQRHGDCPVVVGADRVAAARLLLGAVDIVIADDGLQHLRMARDFEIAVVDGQRGCGNGRLLPAGPLREPSTRLAEVDVVVINGEGGFEWPGALHMQVQGELLRSIDGGASVALASFAGRRVHAVAGTGNPARFFASLRRAGLLPVEHAFPDHHRYLRRDLEFEQRLPILMTEKDAVKCVELAPADCWYLPVEAALSEADTAQLLAKLGSRLACVH